MGYFDGSWYYHLNECIFKRAWAESTVGELFEFDNYDCDNVWHFWYNTERRSKL